MPEMITQQAQHAAKRSHCRRANRNDQKKGRVERQQRQQRQQRQKGRVKRQKAGSGLAIMHMPIYLRKGRKAAKGRKAGSKGRVRSCNHAYTYLFEWWEMCDCKT
jgi:hypothetical protein